MYTKFSRRYAVILTFLCQILREDISHFGHKCQPRLSRWFTLAVKFTGGSEKNESMMKNLKKKKPPGMYVTNAPQNQKMEASFEYGSEPFGYLGILGIGRWAMPTLQFSVLALFCY